MAHVALYREWRPMTFDEVVEQQHAVIALRQAVLTGQIAHAYLFSGTRGTGKTTLAKVFSRAINCLDPKNGNPCNQCSICTGILNGSLLDVVEMDAASNNSVDTIRRICDEVVFMPSQARFKVYIIDEVHMLSTGAFNALLKTLEEPPAHAVFILATTEPHRIPATILSRCQRYEFRRIPLPSLAGRLREIADKDQISVDATAIDMIARLAEGGMRDAISLLDQVRMTATAGHEINRDDVLLMTGVADDDLMEQISRALLSADPAAIIRSVEQLVMAGRDPARFLIDLAAFCRNLLVILITPDPLSLLQITQDQHQRLASLVQTTDSATLVTLIRSLSSLHGDLRWSTDVRTTLEIGLLRIMSDIAGSLQPVSPPAAPLQPAAVRPSVQQSAVQQTAVAADSDEFAEESMPPPPEQPPEFQAIPEPPPESARRSLSNQAPRNEAQTSKGSVMNADAAAMQSIFPFTPSHASADLDQAERDRWQAIQNILLADGQMTLYLFSRPAVVSFCGGELHLLFSQKDQVNYQELNEPQNIKQLRSAATRILGIDTPVVVRIASDPQAEAQYCPIPDEPAWITRVRNAANEFNIPIKMED